MKHVFYLKNKKGIFKKGKYPVYFETIYLAKKVKGNFEVCAASLQDMVNMAILSKLVVVISDLAQLRKEL